MARAAFALAATVVVAGCGAFHAADPKPTTRARVIDEFAGEYRGVRLGDPPSALWERLGRRRPAGEDEAAVPLAAGKDGTDGPTGISFPDDPTAKFEHYRYELAVFEFVDGALLWFETIERGAATQRGVAIGDPLAAVERAYPEAECGTAGGGEYREFEACSAKLARSRWIWFGGDPISTITIAAVPLDAIDVDEPFTGRTFVLRDGDFLYLAGAQPGDRVVCIVDGRRREATVPRPNTGLSIDPMYVGTEPDGRVRAECGGIHAETAPGWGG